MQERMDQLGGNLSVFSSKRVTVIEARVPLSRLLPPEDAQNRREEVTA